jgi:cell wall-associated NlpC family hydrolase
MSDKNPHKGSSTSERTAPVTRSVTLAIAPIGDTASTEPIRRVRPKVRKRRRIGAHARDRLLFYGLPTVVIVLLMTVFIIKITATPEAPVPFQNYEAMNDDGLIRRDHPELIAPVPTDQTPLENGIPETTVSAPDEVPTTAPEVTEPFVSEAVIEVVTDPMASDGEIVVEGMTDRLDQWVHVPPQEKPPVPYVFVQKDTISVYDEPKEGAGVIGHARLNDALVKLSDSYGWVAVRTLSGISGYVRAGDVTEERVFVPEQGATYYVQNRQVYVRSGPGKEHPIEGFGLRGMTLVVLDVGDEWSKIQTENGVTGYMFNDLFGPDKPADEITELEVGRYMYIDTDMANLRESPSLDAEIITTGFLDDRVYQYSDNGGWSRIRTEAGIIAFIRNDLLRDTPPVDPFSNTNRTMYVDTNALNVRQSPTTDAPVLDSLRRDQAVQELATNGTWSKVKVGDRTGFVKGEFLTSVKPPPEGFKRVSGTLYVNSGAVNVRSQPNTNCTIITVVRLGDAVKTVAVGDGWTMVKVSGGKQGYISSDLLSKTKPKPAPSSGGSSGGGTTNPGGNGGGNGGVDDRCLRIVEIAKSCIGLPYIRGGCSMRGLDCSGLVKYCYNAVGYNMRHHGSQAQATLYGRKIPFSGRDFSNLQPGDLVFFSRGYGYHHVGIYAGNNMMIHAVSRRGVVMDNLVTYGMQPVLAKRLIG